MIEQRIDRLDPTDQRNIVRSSPIRPVDPGHDPLGAKR
jgi:hypothetical protein